MRAMPPHKAPTKPTVGTTMRLCLDPKVVEERLFGLSSEVLGTFGSRWTTSSRSVLLLMIATLQDVIQTLDTKSIGIPVVYYI